jgi:inosose dehydratase
MSNRETLSRRELLRRSAAAGAAVTPLLALAASHRAQAADSPYGPFKMGIQSYSLRGYRALEQALGQTQKLGLRYWEAWDGHLPATTDPQQIAQAQELLKAHDVTVLAYGVVGFGGDAAANRRRFEAAKAMGIPTLSADPAPQAFDQLEQLVEEFQINIAIHNHGPGSRWDKIQQVADAVKGRHKRIGACVDTGHFLRSGENPVRAVEVLGERVYGCHLKDVKDGRTFTILGQGDMDTVGVLKALRAAKFNDVLALEYEENPMDPIADLQACLATVRSAVQKL